MENSFHLKEAVELVSKYAEIEDQEKDINIHDSSYILLYKLIVSIVI